MEADPFQIDPSRLSIFKNEHIGTERGVYGEVYKGKYGDKVVAVKIPEVMNKNAVDLLEKEVEQTRA